MHFGPISCLRAFAAAALLCSAALFAAAQFSPVHAEPRYTFEATPGKLPKDVVPKHYSLRIAPTADYERFEGRALIDVEVARPVASITLNAAGLDFNSARLASAAGETELAASFDRQRETATLTPATGAIAAGNYRLTIRYAGNVSRQFRGLYRFPYKVRENDRLADKVMLVTHMEPVHARRLFPGWDEPAFRATFEIAAEVDAPLTVVSNMPVAKVTPLAGGRKEVAFERSVSMPTYLVALFIGEMDVLEDSVDGIALRIYTARGRGANARYAMDVTKEVVHYFNDYFGVRYALPKLDQIAHPGGGGGAMENWGAIAYNEARLLYDPAEPSLRLQQQIYGIVAHEIAHQWFGNLVTMAWWDNLWLNEGFASWMATKTMQTFRPQWQMHTRGVLWRQWAMTEDARKTTHAIQTPVENDQRAMDVFDSITYNKGESFIGMLEGYLGEKPFREGIRRYMKAHAFSNTTTADLWHHLSEASGRDVRTLAAPWTEQPGFPLVKVMATCKAGHAEVTLAQERFTLNDPGAARLVWSVPVKLVGAGGAETSVLLGEKPEQATLARCGPVSANPGNTGYYRVQYDARTLHTLERNLAKLEAPDRLRLLADTFALMQAGRAGAGSYLSLLDRLGAETDPRVWDHVISALRFLRELIEDPAAEKVFDRTMVRVLKKPFARVGWDARAGENPETPLLRRALIDALGRAGDAGVVREAQRRFAVRDTKPLDPAIRSAVLDIVGRNADAATFEALLAGMRAATDVEQKWQWLSALRQTTDPALLRRWMDLLLTTDELPPGEAASNITRSSYSSGQSALVWQFVRANLPAIFAKVSPRGRGSLLPEALGPSADARRADELMEVSRQNLDPTALYPAEKTADWIRLKAAVKARELNSVLRWARPHA